MITNVTTGKIICTEERRRNSFLSLVRGLMFCSPQNFLMIFPQERRISLHTWFVWYPLQIVVLDAEKKVIAVRILSPCSCWMPMVKGKYVLEMPLAGKTSEEKVNLKIGHQLRF